jgi:hypothetical protein
MDNQNPLTQKAQANPLAQYYRRPGTYVRLPSSGRFYSKPPKFSDTGELAVFPMTAKDELILKNPDALFNGEAIKQVVASVCPDIPDVNEIPAADLDMILVAMRMTSYGDDMGLSISHGCDESNGREQSITVSLGSIVASLRPIPSDVGIVKLGSGITVALRPYNLHDQSRLLRMQFNTMRQIQANEENKLLSTEDRTRIATEQYNSMVELAQQLLTGCVEKVSTPDGVEVTDRKHIADWVKNLDRASVDRLDQELKRFQEFGIIREVTTKCDYCGTDYKTDMLFDPTSFFTAGS